MKYIGQNIYDLVSKFRQKVFLEASDLEIRKISGQPTLELSAWSATATAAHAGRIKFLKSGTAAFDTLTAGNHTTAGEILGRIEAYGVDDGDGETLAAYIEFANDAVSDADSSPGKIIFATSDADDAGTPTARLTIDDDGLATFSGAVSIGGNLTFDSVALTGIQINSESFSNDNVSLMTSAAIATYIASFGYGTGDITGMRLTADDSNVITDNTGSIDFTVAGGEGIDTSVSSTTLTIAGEDATTSNKGVASFSSNNFSVSSGAVSLNATQTLDTLSFSSVNTTDPIISLTNTTDDQHGATLKFGKFRGGLDPTSDAQDNDVVGNIVFASVDDGTPSAQDYGKIESVVADATSGQEAGNLNFYVPSYDGVLTKGLALLGDTNADGEVDVTIARGAASTTTVSGDLAVGGNLEVTGDITSVGDDVSVGDNILLTSASGVIQFTGTAGGGGEGVQYKDAGGGNRYGLIFPGSDVVALGNRASNGTVEIRANTSTAGSGGEVTQVTVEDDKVTIAGSLELGHASDTTLARSASGVVTIEGNKIVTSGSSGTNTIMLSAGNGYLSTITADEWYFGNNSYGHTYHLWNNVKASITADEGTFTMSEDYNLVGRLVPEALSKLKLQVSARPAGSGATGETLSVCIVSADRDGAGTNTTWTVLAQGTITQVQGEYDGVDVTYTGSIATSKMLAVGVGSTESGSIGTTNVRFTYALTGYIT